MSALLSESTYSPAKRHPVWVDHLPVFALIGLFLVIITRRAWVGDDAYITFRTVDNFIHGYSLTWNAGERVQAYTHPLWMFTLSFFYFISREIYFTSIFVSLTASIAAVSLYAWRVARTWVGAALGVLILALSNAFVDYSTSGLENPLTHLLLAIFFVVYFGQKPTFRRLFWLSLVASLAGVNRLDTLLLYAPALLYSWWQLRQQRKSVIPLLIGQVPLALWEIFSLVYYGFLFPNTAYAKLNTGVSGGELFAQGFFYLLNSFEHDPLTLLAIFGGILLTLSTRSRRGTSVAAGIALYLLYILKIGGDFMSGRFLTAPLFCAVVLLGQIDLDELRPIAAAGLFGVIIAVGLMAPLPSYRVDIPSTYSLSDEKRINDERAWYFKDVNLLGRSRLHPSPTSQGLQGGLNARAESQKDYYVIPVNNVGLYGFYAGPKVYVIDEYALADPLLARLPAVREANFYIGHFHRIVPQGYVSTIYSGKNQLIDPDLALYYDQLKLVVRGKLFDPQRWAAIWKINTGQLNSLIHTDTYRYPEMISLSLERLNQPGGEHPSIQFGDNGVQVRLVNVTKAAQVAVALDSQADFQLEFLKNGQVIGNKTLAANYSSQPFYDHILEVPFSAIQSGYDAIRIFPIRGSQQGQYHLQGMALVELPLKP